MPVLPRLSTSFAKIADPNECICYLSFNSYPNSGKVNLFSYIKVYQDNNKETMYYIFGSIREVKSAGLVSEWFSNISIASDICLSK